MIQNLCLSCGGGDTFKEDVLQELIDRGIQEYLVWCGNCGECFLMDKDGGDIQKINRLNNWTDPVKFLESHHLLCADDFAAKYLKLKIKDQVI